jgi:hypothetical protein
LQFGVKVIIVFAILVVLMVLVYTIGYNICKHYKRNKSKLDPPDNIHSDKYCVFTKYNINA